MRLFMSLLLILWKPHVTLHWKLGRKLIKKKKQLYLTLNHNIFYSCLFMIYFLLNICITNGNAVLHSKRFKDAERRKYQSDNDGDSPTYNTSVHNAINNFMLNGTGLSKYRDKLKNRDIFTTNHRKTIFKREEKGTVEFTSNHINLKNNNLNVNKKSFNTKEYASSWAVKIPESLKHSGINPEEVILKIADELGLINHGNIGHLPEHFLLMHHTFYDHTPYPDEQLIQLRNSITERLENHPHIYWVNHETVHKRYKRSLEFKDQFFPSQWHLDNLRYVGHDINVTGVWENNITGKGVTISVIDDGVEWNNPDILDNYSAQGSWDLNSNDGDPMPRLDEAGLNHHGTRCAGEIAAVANEYCAVGVAFGANVSGIRILDGPMTDSLEAMAFNTKSGVNDIYSCSWGPDDNGRTVDGPHHLAQAALARGVMTGRHGYGSIFVVASGNGGHFKDNCNFDGYANSIFTVTIGAVDELGQMPYYAERCAAMLAVTYSSGAGRQRNIVTTDWRLGSGNGCTDRHTGTSAAAPLAAGVIALMLEARPCLTWRDVQHLIVYTAVRVEIDPEEWQVNGAGFAHSHKHGFGLIDSWRLVTASKLWPSVPFMTSWSTREMLITQKIPTLPGVNLTKIYRVSGSQAEHVISLEHVTVTVNINHPCRGTLAISLISPHGTISRLASIRKYDKSKDGFVDWTFSTVRCWGERAQGDWRLVIIDKGGKKGGVLKTWRLTFYGSSLTAQDMQARKRLVKKSFSGHYLQHPGPPCVAPPVPVAIQEVLSHRMLKVILLFGGFLFMVGVYFVLETLCDNGHQEEHNAKESDFDTTLDIQQDGVNIDMDQFGVTTLGKDDALRLSNIIEHGTSRPIIPLFNSSLTENNSLESLVGAEGTPDEGTRVKEFEGRLKYALEQSLILQMKQMQNIDMLEKDIKDALSAEGLVSLDVFNEIPAKMRNSKKKLKSILKKPKQCKD